MGCIYRHPKSNVALFTKDLEIIIENVTSQNKLCFITGDLNIHPLQPNHEPTENFTNRVLSLNIIAHITLPTRITDNTATLIDHIPVHHDYTNALDRLILDNFINNISDHLPNFILVDTESITYSKHDDRPYIRLMSDGKTAKFKSYHEGIDWKSIPTDDCISAYSGFMNVFPLWPYILQQDSQAPKHYT